MLDAIQRMKLERRLAALFAAAVLTAMAAVQWVGGVSPHPEPPRPIPAVEDVSR